VYRSVEDQETIWVRPLEMFTEAAAVETGSNTCTGEHAISSLLSQNLKGLRDELETSGARAGSPIPSQARGIARVIP